MRILVAVLTLLVSGMLYASQTPVISQALFLEKVKQDEAMVVLDVRSAAEYAVEHIPGAINISYDELSQRIKELDGLQNEPLIVYCRSGRRAGIAESFLVQQGFTKLMHLEGDFSGWKAAKLTLESSQ